MSLYHQLIIAKDMEAGKDVNMMDVQNQPEPVQIFVYPTEVESVVNM